MDESGPLGGAVAEVQGHQHDDALGDVLGIGAQVDQLHAVGEDAQDKHRSDGLPQGALAALQGHAGENAGDDAGELNAGAGAGIGGAGAGRQQNGGDAHQNVYKLTCEAANAAMLDAVMIQMKAIPTDPTSCGIGSDQFLAGRLRVLMNSGRSTVWTGRFTDMGVTNTPGELDAFNYEISGTAKGDYVLTWETDKVALSPWFLEDIDKTINPGDNSISISLGEPGTPTSYRFVFYRVGGIPEGETWDTVRGYVTFAPANG